MVRKHSAAGGEEGVTSRICSLAGERGFTLVVSLPRDAWPSAFHYADGQFATIEEAQAKEREFLELTRHQCDANCAAWNRPVPST
jgi:hypothetical protein